MSRIMVDDLVPWPLPKGASAQAARVFGGKESCHLTTDGDVEELHAFALKIGMKRAWFQAHRVMDHYDLTPARRAAALRAGAVYVPARAQIIERRSRREKEAAS